jgi:sugar phosphate isomerase/epimerase
MKAGAAGHDQSTIHRVEDGELICNDHERSGNTMLINLDTAMTMGKNIPLETLLPLARRLGYDTIQFPLWEITTFERAKQATREVVDSGLQWGLMPMDIDIMRECPEEIYRADLEALKRQMDLAQSAGVRRYYNHVWPGSNELPWDEKFSWCVERFSPVHEMARERGIRSGLEFLGPKSLSDSFRYPFIRTIRDILRLADAISEEVGVLVDTFHWYTSGSALEDLNLIGSGNRIVGVHLNDGQQGRSREQQQDLERELPLATGIIDSVSVIRTLKELGYEGPVTVEPFEPAASRLQSLPLEDALRKVEECARRVLTLAGVR